MFTAKISGNNLPCRERLCFDGEVELVDPGGLVFFASGILSLCGVEQIEVPRS